MQMQTYQRLWPDRRDGPWLIETEWAAKRGHAECVSIKITPASDLSTIRFSEVLDDMRHEIELITSLNVAAAKDSVSWTQRGRLLHALEVYATARRYGHPHPNFVVADELGITRTAARVLLHRARHLFSKYR